MQLRGIITASSVALAVGGVQGGCVPKNPCKNNAVLSIIEQIKGTSFCAEFIRVSTSTVTDETTVTQTNLRTVTAQVTATDGQTARATTLAVLQDTRTESVDGPTVTVTDFQTSTVIVTNAVTETVTQTNQATSTTYLRNGPVKRLQGQEIPPELKGVAETAISKACRCFVTGVTVTSTSTVFATAEATGTVSRGVTVSPTVATQVETMTTVETVTVTETRPAVTNTATVPDTVTKTTQQVATATVTVTGSPRVVNGRSYNFVQSFSSNCVPYQYRQLYPNVQGIPLTYEALFQYCAATCAADSGCSQIFVALNDPPTSNGFWCLTGGGVVSQTWTSSTFQCNYPPIGRNGYWYNSA